MDKYTAKVLSQAISQPLFRTGIYTRNMAPENKPVTAIEGPSALTFYFELARSNDIDKALRLQKPIALSVSRAMNLPHGKSLKCRITLDGQYLAVGVERLNRWLPTWQDVQASIGGYFFVGYDDKKEPVFLDLFSKKDPGLFVIGKSGSGKTNLLRVLANQARERGIDYYLVDLKGGKDWRYDLGLYAVDCAYDHEKAENITNHVFNVMKERNQTKAKQEPIIFFFDEVTEADEALQETLARISKLCRSSNIRLVVGSQRAGDDVHKEIRANLLRRVVGLVASYDAYNATNIKGSGAEFLSENGDMLVCANSHMKRIQVPRADEEDLNIVDQQTVKPIVKEPTKPKKKALKILTDERVSLLENVPIEEGKRRVFLQWFDKAYLSTNQKLVEKGAKVLDRKVCFFAANHAFKERKPPTIKAVESELKRLEIKGTRRDRVRLYRYFGGLVVGDKKSKEQLGKVWEVVPT